jgi:hypothetical protein
MEQRGVFCVFLTNTWSTIRRPRKPPYISRDQSRLAHATSSARVFAKWPNVWQTDLMGTESFEQFRKSQKPSLHLFGESQEFGLHQSATTSIAHSATSISIAFLR